MRDDQFRAESSPATERERLRRVFRRVMLVQVVALLVLWLLQARFGSG